PWQREPPPSRGNSVRGVVFGLVGALLGSVFMIIAVVVGVVVVLLGGCLLLVNLDKVGHVFAWLWTYGLLAVVIGGLGVGGGPEPLGGKWGVWSSVPPPPPPVPPSAPLPTSSGRGLGWFFTISGSVVLILTLGCVLAVSGGNPLSEDGTFAIICGSPTFVLGG